MSELLAEALGKLMEEEKKKLISELIKDLEKEDDFYTLFDYRLYIDTLIGKWKEKLK